MEKLLVCSLTKEPTSHPMICVKNGLIFDKEIIKNCLKSGLNICPITNMTVSFEKDFRYVRGLEGPTLGYKSNANRMDTLKNLIESYRGMVIEAKGQKETIELLKKKLKLSLKQQKASLRLIGTLQEQRDEARQYLTKIDHIENFEEENKEIEMDIESELESLRDEIKTNKIRLNKVRKELAKANTESLYSTKKMGDVESKSFNLGVPNLKKFSPLVLSHPFNSDIWFIGGTKNSSSLLIDYENGVSHQLKDEIFGKMAQAKTSNLISDDDNIGYVMATSDGGLYAGKINLESGDNGVGIEEHYDFGCKALEEHPINRLFLHLDDQRNLRLFDINEERMVMACCVESDLEINSMGIHPDGKLVALNGTNGQIHFLDLTSGEVVITLEGSKVIIFLIFL